MSTEQRQQQQPTQTPAPQSYPRREFVKKGAVASAATREVIKRVLGDEAWHGRTCGRRGLAGPRPDRAGRNPEGNRVQRG